MLFFGILLLFSYYYFLRDKNNNEIFELWGKMSHNLVKLYYVSMFLSLIGFILFFTYLFKSNSFTKKDIQFITTSIIFIFIFSILWTPLSLQYLNNQNIFLMFFILFVLFFVSLFTFILLYVIYNVPEKKNVLYKNLALYGMYYFFLHVFILDFIIWSFHFFNSKKKIL
jgi:hypothetical protein